MPATTGGRPTSGSTRSNYRRPRRRSRPAPPPAPKPDVTLGGDRTPKRSGYTRARTPEPASQGHPSRGGTTVSGGTRRHPRTSAYKSPTPSLKKQRRQAQRTRQEEAQRRALMRYTRSKLRGFQQPMRDPDTKILGVNVEAELEGRGVLPKIGKAIGKLASKGQHSSAGGFGGGAPNKLLGNASKDAADLTANLPSGLYLTGAAAKEAAFGDTKRAKKLIKGFKKTSAAYALVTGHPGEALKRAEKRPVSTALEVSGGKALVGRNAGRVMRSGALGQGAKRAASTERAALRLYPDGLGVEGPTVKRKYSSDVITKAGQVARERSARKRGNDPNVDRGRIHGAGVSVTRPGKPQLENLIPQSDTGARSQLMHRIDDRIAASERVRRGRVQQTIRDTSRLAPHESTTRYPLAARKGAVERHESPLVQLVAEGTVTSLKTARSELKARLRHLDRRRVAAEQRHPAHARGNRAEAAQIRELLKLDDRSLERVFAAAEEFKRQEAGRQARLRETGQYDAAQQATRWFPYLQSHHHLEGAELREAAVKLEQGADRVKVGDEIIRRPKIEPAFITQRPIRLSGGRATEAYQPPMRGAGASAPPGGKRAGTAYDLGAREVGAEALVRQAITSEGRATAAETFQLIGKEFGVPAGEDGHFFADSYTRALEQGQRLTHDDVTGQLKPGQRPLVPVNIDGFAAYGDKLREIQKNIAPERQLRAEEDALAETLGDALKQTSGRGHWILMPDDVVARLVQHANVRTADLQGITNIFKDVVLTTSSPTTWLAGNISDLGFRSIMEGIRPTDVMRGRAVVRQTETHGLQGEMAAAAVARGGLFHTSSMSERFSARRVNETVARTIAAAPWRAWKGGVYALEEFFEHMPQYGRVGKAARQGDLGRAAKVTADDRAFVDKAKELLKLHDQQIDFYAERLATDRALEARIQQLTEDVIGRWGKLSPRMRKHLALAPFVQWLGAALRYTLVTLPVRHPIKSAIFAGIMEMTADERARLGLSYMIPQDQRVQDYQMGTLPMNIGRNKFGLQVSGIGTSNLTSFGTAGQFPNNIPGFMLPQLRGAFGALAGQAFTGEDMVYPDWWPDESLRGLPLSKEDRVKVGVGALIESTVPFASSFRRAVLDKGRSSMPYSSILTPATRKRWDKEHKEWRDSEGSLWGGISEWLNPFRTNKLVTYGDVKDIRENQQRGKVFEELRQAGDKKYFNDAGGGTAGKEAVRIKHRLAAIRKQGKPGSTPEERELQTRLYQITDGKHGYEYKSGDGSNPFGSSGGTSSDDNPFGESSQGPSSSGDENPF